MKSIINKLKDNSIIIASSSLKKLIFNNLDNSKLNNIEFISYEFIKKKLNYEYDLETIYYLEKKYNYQPSYIEILLNNLIFSSLDNEKGKLLKEIEVDLLEKNLIRKDQLFLKKFKNKNVYVIGNYINDHNLAIIKTNIPNIIQLETSKAKQEVIALEFNSIEEEIVYITNSIAKLILEGVPYNKIKLINVKSSYKEEVKRVFDFFNLDYSLEETILGQLPIAKEILTMLKQNLTFKEVLENLIDKYSNDEKFENIYYKIEDLFNRFNWYSGDNLNLINIITHELNKIKIIKNNSNSINISELNIEYLDDNYVYFIGFNKEYFLFKNFNQDYISDYDKKSFNINTSEEIYHLKMNQIYYLLPYFNNLVLTYSLNNHLDSLNILNPNFKIKKINLKEEKTTISYSKKNDISTLSYLLENYLKKGEYNNQLVNLYSNLDSSELVKFDNQFKLKKQLNLPNLNLSFTSLDTYLNCKFKYFLNYILKVKEKETIYLKVGVFYHQILSKIYLDDFNFEKVYQDEFSKYEFNNEEALLIKNKKNDLEEFSKILISNEKKNYQEITLENNFSLNLDNNFVKKFTAKIDKILSFIYKDKELLIISDYKSSNISLSSKLVGYNLDLQLLVYLYLIKQNRPQSKIIGLYKQISVPKNTYYKNVKDRNKLVDSIYRYKGFNHEEYNPAELINNALFDQRKDKRKYYQDDLINKELEKLQESINEFISNYKKQNFDINPKFLGSNNSCTNCKFKEICYVKYEDKVFIYNENEKENEED